MSTYVRVRDARTGHHYTTSGEHAERTPELQVLDAPACDVNGAPLPPRIAVPKAKPTPETKKSE